MNPKVTIIVVPRERFSHTRQSLESIYANTGLPFDLVYVDAGSPGWIKRYLGRQAPESGFRLLRTEHYLTPNEARNLGLREAKTEFIVFVDNDVHVTPGWLEAMLECAEQTGAWVVTPVHTWGPLTAAGPDLDTVHSAGGDAGFVEQGGRVRLYEHTHHSMEKLADVRPRLSRGPTGVAEFHCVLIRREVVACTVQLDEELKNTREHTDFSMRVRQAGGSIFLEPDAVISYVTAPPFAWSDISLYLFRWSRLWNDLSLARMNAKWKLNDDYAGLRTNWLIPQRRVALRPLRNAMTKVMGGRLGDILVDTLERAWIWNAMRKRRRAGLDAELGPAGFAATQAENS